MTEIIEQKLAPEMAKKIWHIVRAIAFMVRKGIAKPKLMLDLNLMMKRGKIAGRKAIGNLLLLTFNHHHHHGDAAAAAAAASSSSAAGHRLPLAPTDYEFSCSNSPAGPTFKSFLPFSFHNSHKPRRNHHLHFFSCAHAPPLPEDSEEDLATVNVVKRVLEMLNGSEMAAAAAAGGSSPHPAVLASPVLPGFGFDGGGGRGRRLRITDSPYPLAEAGGGDCHVDELAEEFIQRFYKELKQQDNNKVE